MLKTILAIMISLSSIGFTHEASEDWNNELSKAIQANENAVVDHYDEDKIYLNPDKIHPTPQGIYLNLNDQEFIFVPTLSSDAQGSYVNANLAWDPDPRSVCPGCNRRYIYPDCGNPNCEEYKRRHQNTENHKREQERKKDDYKRSKKEKNKNH
jgi:hypothetical protein